MISFLKSRKYIYIQVIVILLYTHIITCQTDQLNFHDVNDTTSNRNRSLPMNVEWVLQGFSLGFTGFFVEYLGLSSSIVQLLPYSTLQKSSYRKTFNESHFTTEYSIFSKELFPKEAKNIEYLISRRYSKRKLSQSSDHCFDCIVVNSSIDNSNINNNNNNNSDYHPRFLYSPREQSVIKPSICIDFKSIIIDDDQQNAINSTSNETAGINVGKHILTNIALVGGDLARGYASLNETNSAFECCEYCYSNILCLSWTFDNNTGIIFMLITTYHYILMLNSIFALHKLSSFILLSIVTIIFIIHHSS